MYIYTSPELVLTRIEPSEKQGMHFFVFLGVLAQFASWRKELRQDAKEEQNETFADVNAWTCGLLGRL